MTDDRTDVDTQERTEEATTERSRDRADEPIEERTRERTGSGPGSGGILVPEDADGFSKRWEDIQARFVDQPQESVSSADALVDDVVNAITSRLTEQRQELESRWHRDEEVSTEDLRQTLRSYRELFERLLSARG